METIASGALPRRSALRGLVCAAALSACGSDRGVGARDAAERAFPTPPPIRPASRVIDAHCHVFNVDDLPVYRFLKHVALPERCIENLDALAWFLARTLKALAPGVDAERRALGGGPRASMEAARAPVDDPSRRERAVREALRALRDRAEGRPTPRAAVDDDAPPPHPAEAAALLRALERETAAPGAGGRRRAAPGGRAVPDDASIRAIARDLAMAPGRADGVRVRPRAALSPGKITAVFRWALQLAGFRHRLAGDLAAISGAPSRPVLLTPAMVDFGPWINADQELPTDAADAATQLELMALVARARPGGAFVHPFVPYDPWRAAVDLAAGRPNRPLAAVRDGIERGGAVGVKLYPPMGFRAWRNAALEPGAFPAALRRATRGQPGLWLDRALGELYADCAALDAPVMAHAADSNEAQDNAGRFADPAFWEAAVVDFPGLRVNLGHFGGVWLLDGDDQRCGQRSRENWTRACAELIARRPDQVWGDLSYFAELLTEGPARPAAVEALRGLARHPAAGNLLYGSDWIMVGQEGGADEYTARVSAAAAEAGLDPERFAWRSAARFLGLDRAGRPRDRLLAFHASDPAAAAGIQDFMPGLASS